MQDIQSVVQIRPEAVGGHFAVQILVGRGYDAHINGDDPRSADAPDLLFLNDAQQLGLQIKGHFPYLVEKERPAVGKFKHAGRAVFLAAGECPGLVAEQLAFHERCGNGGAVDGQERFGTSPARIVYAPGHHFLACTAFARDQNRLIGPGKTTGAFQQFLKQEPPAVEIIKGMFGLSRFGRVVFPDELILFLDVRHRAERTDRPDNAAIVENGPVVPHDVDAMHRMGMGFLGFPSFQHGLERILGEYIPRFSADNVRSRHGKKLFGTLVEEGYLVVLIDRDDGLRLIAQDGINVFLGIPRIFLGIGDGERFVDGLLHGEPVDLDREDEKTHFLGYVADVAATHDGAHAPALQFFENIRVGGVVVAEEEVAEILPYHFPDIVEPLGFLEIVPVGNAAGAHGEGHMQRFDDVYIVIFQRKNRYFLLDELRDEERRAGRADYDFDGAWEFFVNKVYDAVQVLAVLDIDAGSVLFQNILLNSAQ